MTSHDDEPSSLSTEAASYVAAYRKVVAPPPVVRDRVWRQVSETNRTSRRRAVRWTGGAVLLVAAGVVLALSAPRFVGLLADSRRLSEAPSVATPMAPVGTAEEGPRSGAKLQRAPVSDADEAGGGAKGQEVPAVDAARPPLPTVTSPANDPATESSPRREDRGRRDPSAHGEAPLPRATTAAVPPAGGDARLRAEQAMIEAAWAALRRGDAAGARGWAQRHQAEFPEGVLAPERDAVLAITSCQSRTPDATQAATRFLAAHGGILVSDRVREACAAILEPGRD